MEEVEEEEGRMEEVEEGDERWKRQRMKKKVWLEKEGKGSSEAKEKQ